MLSGRRNLVLGGALDERLGFWGERAAARWHWRGVDEKWRIVVPNDRRLISYFSHANNKLALA